MFFCQINFPAWVRANIIGYSLSCCVPEMKEKHIYRYQQCFKIISLPHSEEKLKTSVNIVLMRKAALEYWSIYTVSQITNRL